jgi:hypothetical protein
LFVSVSLFLLPVQGKGSFPENYARIQNTFKLQFVGEIIGYSYLKMSLESTEYAKSYKSGTTALRGSYYEARSSSTYKIIGSYNGSTNIWKLDCFDRNNILTSVFLGKTNSEDILEGTWTSKTISRKFYLKRNGNN